MIERSTQKKFIQMMETLEQIVTIFKTYPEGLTTTELYRAMQTQYDYAQTSKNLKVTYFPLLEAEAIKGVIFHQNPRGKHTLEDKRFDKALDQEKKVYIKLALETVENLNDISRHHHDICTRLNLDTLDLPFYIKPENYQKLDTDEEEVHALEEAILNDNVIAFYYRGDTPYHVEPYRLVNFDGIWYLYGKDLEEKEDNVYKTWMLEFIDDVEIFYSQKHTISDDEIDRDLANAHDALFVPDRSIEVILHIAPAIVDIIRLKTHFPQQKILKDTTQGLTLRSVISTTEEILPEIKSFLPHISITSPDTLREQLMDELTRYIQVENHQ